MLPVSKNPRAEEGREMPWYKKGDVSKISSVPAERVVCFDTETTGVNPGRDEILQLSVVDGNGTVLFSDYVRPERRKSWPKAQEVNGISPSMVKGKRTIAELLPELDAIFSQAGVLVAYNIEFDAAFLERAGVSLPSCPWFDVMKEFAPVGGRWNERHEDFGWVKLAECARHYGYRFNAHDALEDARATLHCFRAMLEDEAEGGYLWVVERYRLGREKSARAMAQMEAERREAEERRRAELEERRVREEYERSPRGVAERAVASGEAKLVSKTAYVCLAVLLGWIGAHEFYAGRTAWGILYVVFCWTFVPWIVAIVQAIRVAREETVEPGRVLIWKKAKRG